MTALPVVNDLAPTKLGSLGFGFLRRLAGNLAPPDRAGGPTLQEFSVVTLWGFKLYCSSEVTLKLTGGASDLKNG